MGATDAPLSAVEQALVAALVSALVKEIRADNHSGQQCPAHAEKPRESGPAPRVR
jgi:hypothetical protein